MYNRIFIHIQCILHTHIYQCKPKNFACENCTFPPLYKQQGLYMLSTDNLAVYLVREPRFHMAKLDPPFRILFCPLVCVSESNKNTNRYFFLCSTLYVYNNEFGLILSEYSSKITI